MNQNTRLKEVLEGIRYHDLNNANAEVLVRVPDLVILANHIKSLELALQASEVKLRKAEVNYHYNLLAEIKKSTPFWRLDERA